MNSTDLRICQHVISSISSNRYKSSNLLFLEPVDLTHFPTYTTIVKKPMDLGTIAKNLNNGIYETKEEFMSDTSLCFENAELFHKDKPENAWIIKDALKMKKHMKKELALGEKKFNVGAIAVAPTDTDLAVASDLGGGETKKPKLSLKLNKPSTLQQQSTTSQPAPDVAPNASFATNKSISPASSSIAVETEAATDKKPKLKLKLKLSSKKTPGSTFASTPTSLNDNGLTIPDAAELSTTTSSDKKSKTKPTSTPKSTPSSQPRGKELPVAIAAAAKASTKKEKSSSKDATASRIDASTPTTTGKKIKFTTKPKIGDMTIHNIGKCTKVLSALKHREEINMSWFMKPVKSLYKGMDDYEKRIPFPMDVSTMSSKLDKNSYPSVSDFILDLRRIFGNCLRYNIDPTAGPVRETAVNMLIVAEQFSNTFIADSDQTLYPKLLYCWKVCLEILDAVLALKTQDGKQTAWYFLYPASFFFGGKLSQAYKNKVKTPMDFGTISSNLIEGHYQSVDAFVKDCRLVTSNCKAYYQEEENGQIYLTQAIKIEEFLSPRLEKVLQYDRSEQGLEARRMAAYPTPFKFLSPPKAFYTSILEELRSTTYTDKFTKIIESAALPFEDPVDVSVFKDYLQFVELPMDLKTIESKINAGKYERPEDFEFDVNLIFKNCEAYNNPKQNIHIVNLSKHCAKVFKKMYSPRIKAFEASGGKKWFGEDKKRLPEVHPVETMAPPAKKIKIESASAKRKSPITLPTPIQQQTAKGGKSSPKAQGQRIVPRIVIRTDGPLHPHEAIAKVKESFTCRRQKKDLNSWEDACSKFFGELKKHPWISSSKRFVFDAPVTMLHPEIKEAYTRQIQTPMDLTTAEAKLLQGGIYSEPQDFVDDVALVFSNAVAFNKSGYEQGDPTSMAYYDASKHLLKYTRWLSLEYLSQFLIDDTYSEGGRQFGPLPHWKLSTSNRNDAKDEREEIVMKQDIEMSEDGERFTWQEIECEKLLKSLRRHADSKRMMFFISSKYPQDYDNFITHRMDWETCDKKFQAHKYDTFGAIISDLRLIFSNARNYNGRKLHDPVSKQAYESAEYMSGKLEAAILVTAECIEREKVEDIILSREAEINEKAEEERLRAWEKENEGLRGSSNDTSKLSSAPTVKIIQRRVRRDLDFDNLFPDRESSHDQSEIINNKMIRMYEKQQQDRVEMLHIARNVGVRVFHNLFWRSQAIHWAKEMSEKIQENLGKGLNLQNPAAETMENDKQMETSQKESIPQASTISNLLENSDRTQVKLQLNKSSKQKRSKKRKRLFLD